MFDQSIEKAERVSALVDGQLQGDEFAQTLADLSVSSEARSSWDTYHVLGDVMRSGDIQVHAHDVDFVKRLSQRISENAIKMEATPVIDMRASAEKYATPASANDASWRRVASVAAVTLAGVLAWQGLHWGSAADPASAPQLAQQSVTPSMPSASSIALAPVTPAAMGQSLVRNDGTSALVMTPGPAVMIRDPQLDALLAAHQQFGGTSALQMPSGFLRNATFEEGNR